MELWNTVGIDWSLWGNTGSASLSLSTFTTKTGAVRPYYTSVNIYWNTRRLIQEGCSFISPPCENQVWHKKRQAIYVYSNNESRSCNHCWSGKATSVTYSECVCVRVHLDAQHAMRIRRIHCRLWPVRLYNIFHIIS